jgi:Zn-finger protein
MITRKRCVLCNHEDREQFERELENMETTPDALDERMGWASGTSSKHQRNHMGHFHNSSNPKCVICTSPIRVQLEEQLHSGEVVVAEVATSQGCTEAQVLRHMKNHLQPLVQQSAANLIAVREVNEIDSLSKNINRLDEKIDILFREEEMDAKYIDSLTKLAKEIRESLKYLMEFKGKLVHKRQDTIIVHQMQVIKEVLAQNHPEVWLDVRKQMEEKMQ